MKSREIKIIGYLGSFGVIASLFLRLLEGNHDKSGILMNLSIILLMISVYGNDRQQSGKKVTVSKVSSICAVLFACISIVFQVIPMLG